MPLTMETYNLVNETVSSLCSTNPHVPPYVKELPIHPVSLLDAAPLTSLHTFPQKLDIHLLRQSIQLLSEVFPSISSRYRVDYPADGGLHGKYWFSLDQQPIPFSHQLLDRDEAFPGSRYHVNQESFGILCHPLSPAALWPNTDSPMVAFRYTSFASGRSCIGITLVHIVADAATHYMIINLLSSIYEAGASVSHLEPKHYPLFDIGLALPRPMDDIPNLPPLLVTALYRVDPPVSDALAPLDTIQLSLSPKEIKAMKAESQACLPDNSPPISTMDVLSGWLSSLPLRNTQCRTDTIIYVVDMRAIGVVPPNFAGDAVLVMDVDVRDEDHSNHKDGSIRKPRMAFVASRIREAIVSVRSDPQLVADWIDITANRLEAALLARLKPAFAYDDQTVFINSYFRTDWGTVTFGFPRDEVRYHFAAPLEHQPRVYKSHLEKGQADVERSVAVEFKVLRSELAKALETIKQDRIRWEGD